MQVCLRAAPLLWRYAYRLWHLRRRWVGWKVPADPMQTPHIPVWLPPFSRSLSTPLSYQTASGQSRENSNRELKLSSPSLSSRLILLSDLSENISSQKNRVPVYLWSLIHPGQQWVSQDFGSGFLYAATDKLLIDWFLHKHPGSSQTALALVKEQTTVGLLHCVLYCKRDT